MYSTPHYHERTAYIQNVFSSVATRYDRMNDAMSLGWHRMWKKYFVGMMALTPRSKILDVAGGTGDIAFRMIEKAKSQVMLYDINIDMIEEGKRRAIDKNYWPYVKFSCGNGDSLPFYDNHFDFYTIAFGIRNILKREEALKEAYRVIKPGGRFLCLEFSPNVAHCVKPGYDFYSDHIIPRMGKMIADDAESYHYLVDSIRAFPAPNVFAKMIEEAGFKKVRFQPLSLGIVAIHSGWKI